MAKARTLLLAAVLCAAAATASAEIITGGGAGSGSGGAGTVTSVAAGCGGVATPSPITTTGTISSLELVNAQVGTTYTMDNSDCGKLVTYSNAGSVAVTLPTPNTSSHFIAGWFNEQQALTGSGTITFTPPGGIFITVLRRSPSLRVRVQAGL